MSMLLFHVGDSRYAIENSSILRVIPFVHLKPIFHAPPYLAGLLNVSGQLVPAIDFCELMEQRKAFCVMHTRIILVSDTIKHESCSIIGLIGEQVTETVDLQKFQFAEPNFSLRDEPYLDGICNDEKGMIWHLNIRLLFSFLANDLFNLSKANG